VGTTCIVIIVIVIVACMQFKHKQAKHYVKNVIRFFLPLSVISHQQFISKSPHWYITIIWGYSAIWVHTHSPFFRECLGPIVGGALVYKVGFQSMAAVSHSVVSCYVRSCSRLIPRPHFPSGLGMRLVLWRHAHALHYDRLISAYFISCRYMVWYYLSV